MTLTAMFLISICAAQAQTTTGTLETSETSGTVLSLVMPEHGELRFVLDEEANPDPIVLRFDAPDTDTLVARYHVLMGDKASEAAQIVRGLGGDAQAKARELVYQDLIAEQARLEARLQGDVDRLVQLRCLFTVIRRAQGGK